MDMSSEIVKTILNLSPTISRMQFAPASEWEKCEAVTKDTDAEHFGLWLDGLNADKIGAEAFFDVPTLDISGAFAGFRVSAERGTNDALISIVRYFLERAEFTLNDFLSAAGKISGASMFCGEPEFLELGAVNQWNSFGAMCFWKKGGGDKFSAFKSALGVRRDFMDAMTIPAAVEFAFTEPLPHWLGFFVSSEKDGKYFLSAAKTEKLLNYASDII